MAIRFATVVSSYTCAFIRIQMLSFGNGMARFLSVALRFRTTITTKLGTNRLVWTQRSGLTFGRTFVRILAGTPAFLSEASHSFSHFEYQRWSSLVKYILPIPLKSSQFIIHSPFYTIRCKYWELRKISQKKKRTWECRCQYNIVQRPSAMVKCTGAAFTETVDKGKEKFSFLAIPTEQEIN
jgi:hypothetical protein